MAAPLGLLQHTSAPRQNRTAQNSALATGQQFLRQHRYGEAMDQFETALIRSSEDALARKGETDAAIAWAAAEVEAQHPDAAMLILERGMAHAPESPELLRSFGLEAIALEQFPIARQALDAAHRLKPGDPMTIYALARLELEQQHLPEAERDLTTYLRARPGDASAYFGLGEVYAMEQRTDEARAAFTRSLKLQPHQTESLYQLGELDLQAQNDAAAATLFGQVLARNAKHAGALTGMGQLALRAREYARAEQLLRQAEVSDPAYKPPHYYRGLALARLGRADEARAEMAQGDSRPHAAATTGQSSNVAGQP